jgi:hypothetical protein
VSGGLLFWGLGLLAVLAVTALSARAVLYGPNDWEGTSSFVLGGEKAPLGEGKL